MNLFAASLQGVILVDFNFDNNLTNNGTLGGTGSFVTLTNNPTSEVPTYTANGGGVSGFLGDYAMDNYSATGMGSGGYGGAVQLSPFTPSTNFTALTFTGWYRTTVADETNGRILSTNNGTNIGFQLLFSANNQLRFQVVNNGHGSGTLTADSSISTSLDSNDTWIFFAVVFDGSGTPSVTFYNGNKTTSASLLNSVTVTPTAIGTRASEVLNIGNASGLTVGTQRPWDGLLDNIRIYDSALTLSEIESIRYSALPEPSTFLIFAACIGVLLFLRRRLCLVGQRKN